MAKLKVEKEIAANSEFGKYLKSNGIYPKPKSKSKPQAVKK